MAKPGMKSKEAIESLKERMSRDPLSRAFLQLAEEYRKAGQYAEAVRVCQEGLSRHPTYHTARISLGRTYLESGDLENARRVLSEVLELAPENHLAGKLLAEVQRRTGDISGAAETYRAILRHYPGDREIEALARDLQAPRDLPSKDPGSVAQSPRTPGPGAARAVAPPAAPPRPLQALPVPSAAPPRPPQALPVPPAAPSSRQAVSSPSEPAFDYRPEDLGQSMGPASHVEAAAGPPPAENAGADALQTNTLAELYLRQGLVEKALEVYRAMLHVDPGNEKIRRRLAELSTSGTAIPGHLNTNPTFAASGTSARTAAGHDTAEIWAGPAVAAPADPGHRASIDRLERWLRSIRGGAGSTTGAGGR